MKNQYIGDIGDYGKYGMLRMLRNINLNVGINWYLTPNDTRNDGNINTYLKDGKYRNCDAELFDFLKYIAFKEDKSIKEIEERKILGNNVTFYSDFLTFEDEINFENRREIRKDWHRKALEKLDASDVVFIDPDNGVEVKSCSITSKNGNRYISKKELKDYLSNEKSCIVYNHRKRMTEQVIFSEYKSMVEEIVEGKHSLAVLSFLRGTRRDYLVIMQPEHKVELEKWIEEVINSGWGAHFELTYLIE